MNLFLTHLNYMPFIYGLVMAIAAIMLMHDLATGQIIRFVAIVAYMWIGFSIHGHAIDSRMGVAISALIIHIIWPMFFGRRA